MAWNSDFLMRRFLGEHPSTAQEDFQPEQQADETANPNLQDLPETPMRGGGEAAAEANPFWSERLQGEFQLRQMRPDHLPPLEEVDPWEALGTNQRSSEGPSTSEALMMTGPPDVCQSSSHIGCHEIS